MGEPEAAGTPADSIAPDAIERTPSEILRETVESEAARLDAEARERADVAKLIAALGKPANIEDLTKLEKEVAKVEAALPPERAAAFGVDALLAAARGYVTGAEERIRRQLGLELKAACEREGLEFRVVSREDPVEVRIPPFLLRLDFRVGRADLLFAREVVGSAKAEAEAILMAHAAARRRLEPEFTPDVFLDECLAAYRAALAVLGRPFGERVEILDFLPYLAVGKQSKRFRASPSKESFASYGKARFAYDVLRLRRAGALARNGLRLNFGVATGTTATQKSRVIYLEDEQGDGEYKLTVFFSQTGER